MSRRQFSLLLGLLLCALGLVNGQQRARRIFVELEKAQIQARQLDVEWDQLQLEQSNWSKASLVDRAARRDLRMQNVVPARTHYIQQPAVGGQR